MPEPIRLSKRVVDLLGCSRSDAEQYILGGWVWVDGEVVDEPQHKILDQVVQLDPKAKLAAPEPATLLLHKPAGVDSGAGENSALTLVGPDSRSDLDFSGVRPLRRHFVRLTAVMPLETQASGLLVLTQDPRVLRRMKDDADRIEQELIVEVSGEIVPYGLKRLEHGLSFEGRALPPMKVSWQNETRLRFALKGVRDGQIAAMCAQVGLQVVAIKRIRIGSVPLAKMAVGQWRYLPASARL